MQKAVAKGVKVHKVGTTLGATLQTLLGDGVDALTAPRSSPRAP